MSALRALRRSAVGMCLAIVGPDTRRRLAGLAVLAVVVSVVEVLSALVIAGLLSVIGGAPAAAAPGGMSTRLLQAWSQESRGVVMGVTALFFLCRASLVLFQSYAQNRTAHRASSVIGRKLLHRYLAMPYPAFINRNSSELIRNAHESSMSLVFLVLMPGIVIASEALVVLALITVLVLASPVAAVATMGLLGTFGVLLLKLVQPRILRLGHVAHDARAASLKTLQQALLGLRDIRVLGRESYFVDQFAETRQRLARAHWIQGVLSDVPRLSLETGVLIGLVILVAVQLRAAASSEATALLGLFAYTAFRVLPSVNRIAYALQSARFARPVVDSLYADLAADERPAPDMPAGGDGMGPFAEMQLVDVSYRHGGRDRHTLAHVTLTIRRGESVGVVGRTGSGKSTLLDLMLGLLDPAAGEIFVNGQPLSAVTRQWQQRIGLVPQSVFLTDESIRSNVALGVPPPDVDEHKLMKVLHAAELGTMVRSWPDGLDTVVGERGVKLSGGQRQRIAIARALYVNPEVLVFDEGTSALDDDTEARVLANIKAGWPEVTTIHVAHRLGTIRRCERVILIRDGSVAAEGAFEDLLKDSAEFRALARSHTDAVSPSGDTELTGPQ